MAIIMETAITIIVIIINNHRLQCKIQFNHSKFYKQLKCGSDIIDIVKNSVMY